MAPEPVNAFLENEAALSVGKQSAVGFGRSWVELPAELLDTLGIGRHSVVVEYLLQSPVLVLLYFSWFWCSQSTFSAVGVPFFSIFLFLALLVSFLLFCVFPVHGLCLPSCNIVPLHLLIYFSRVSKPYSTTFLNIIL